MTNEELMRIFDEDFIEEEGEICGYNFFAKLLSNNSFNYVGLENVTYKVTDRSETFKGQITTGNGHVLKLTISKERYKNRYL